MLGGILANGQGEGQSQSQAGENGAEPNEVKEYLNALKNLPPLRPSFQVMGGLLVGPRPTNVNGENLNANSNGSTSTNGANANVNGDNHGTAKDMAHRVSTLIRTEVLGEFLLSCMQWIHRAQEEEKKGEVCDDRVGTATEMVGLFF